MKRTHILYALAAIPVVAISGMTMGMFMAVSMAITRQAGLNNYYAAADNALEKSASSFKVDGNLYKISEIDGNPCIAAIERQGKGNRFSAAVPKSRIYVSSRSSCMSKLDGPT